MKVLFVFGTRPEAIKLAPVIKELSGRANFDCKICVTGQHREMLAQVLELFDLQPDWNLDLMRSNQDLAYLTGAALSGVGEVLDAFQPDRVFVQGDTTTTFAGALAGFYHRIPVAHVEAGLRTDNIYSPWPEEVNRRLVSHIADLHFAPTPQARENLLREGIGLDRILVTGNTGIDALLWVSALLDSRADLRSRYDAILPAHFEGRHLVLMTGHRRESFDGGIARICSAMARIAERSDVAVVFPVHRNPNVRRAVEVLHRHSNLVTGGAGFMGSHLVDALLKQGHAVRVLDDLSNGVRENLSPHVDLMEGDVTNSCTVKQAFEDIDGCFHLAAIASVERSNREWLRTHEVNLTGTI